MSNIDNPVIDIAEIGIVAWIGMEYRSEADLITQDYVTERLGQLVYQFLETDPVVQRLLEEHNAELLQPTAAYR